MRSLVFWRPGRFEHVVLVPSPDEHGRLAILEGLKRKGVAFGSDVDLKEFAGTRSLGFTGADLSHLVRRAALVSLRHNNESVCIRQSDMLEAVREHWASVGAMSL